MEDDRCICYVPWQLTRPSGRGAKQGGGCKHTWVLLRGKERASWSRLMLFSVRR